MSHNHKTMRSQMHRSITRYHKPYHQNNSHTDWNRTESQFVLGRHYHLRHQLLPRIRRSYHFIKDIKHRYKFVVTHR